MVATNPKPPSRSWPTYRDVWRWHFYAGIFCLPFVIVLAISGSIYLFKQEIEAWIDSPYDHLSIEKSAPTSPAKQIAAALASVENSRLMSYEVPATKQSSARVLVRKDGESIRTYVHPSTYEVLHQVPDKDRFMRQIFRIHGTLMIGENGSYLVELAASWTLVMILSGLFLWWPRSAKGWGGVLYPRLRGAKNIFWRDLHSVTGIWISLFAVILLVSGLPWSNFWGDYFKTIRKFTGTAVARQDWSNRGEQPSAAGGSRAGGGEHAEHRKHAPSAREEGAVDYEMIDKVVEVIAPLDLPHPIVISPPAKGDGQWSVKSMTANRPYRVSLVVDAAKGEVVSRENFADRHWIDQVVGYGIAIHEGRLFGWPNQLLGLLTAVGLVLLSMSGAVMW